VDLRRRMLQLALVYYKPEQLRNLVCQLLQKTPDSSSHSDADYNTEMHNQVSQCEWFRVFDIIEALYRNLVEIGVSTQTGAASSFEELLNEFVVANGIGWRLQEGQVVTRGEEVFEAAVKTAQAELDASGRLTASRHIHEALLALSRKPDPNLAGAVYHAKGSLECVLRPLTDEPKLTLGDVLKKHPEAVPKPLDTALSKIWGYASNEARHVLEGPGLGRAEAELIVALAATVATYLNRKASQPL
jgi:hypothetical protein